eukprot:4292783-Pleurochrysis_carterae.AAC.4
MKRPRRHAALSTRPITAAHGSPRARWVARRAKARAPSAQNSERERERARTESASVQGERARARTQTAERPRSADAPSRATRRMARSSMCGSSVCGTRTPSSSLLTASIWFPCMGWIDHKLLCVPSAVDRQQHVGEKGGRHGVTRERKRQNCNHEVA